MKYMIQYILKIIARRIYRKYRPEVIGITGSMGKTGAREAVNAVLSDKFSVRASRKNYNNEIGLPLTLIGADSPGADFFGWLGVFMAGISLILKTDPDYPKILILEMAADKPGDIGYLLDMVECRIGILTRIAEVHLEAFRTLERIKKEKAFLLKSLPAEGWAILNFDDERIVDIAKELKTNYISYGLNSGHDLYGSDVNISKTKGGWGVQLKMHYKGAAVPVVLPGAVSPSAVYAGLAGAAAGTIYGLNLIEISEALKKYKSPRGRMNLLSGVKKTLIIDDTYNSSPKPSIAALEVLSGLQPEEGGSRWAVFGDMLELGDYTEAGHREVGERTAELKIDYLVTVGEKSRDITRGAREAGMAEDRLYHFDDKEAAGKFVQDKIKPGDIILVKGSQNTKMEAIVKEILADPVNAGELLVRQGKEWE